MSNKLSAKISLWVGRVIGLALVVMSFLMPMVLNWCERNWNMTSLAKWMVGGAYYLCLPGIFLALGSVDCLLRNILRQEVFTNSNVERIRCVRWCCAAVGLLCTIAACWFAMLYFLAVIMFFLAFIISVVKNVMAAAVELREENDLTV